MIDDTSSGIMLKMYQDMSKQIKSGNDYTFYLIYCTACNKFKRILSSPPAGPGGTLSCPICREKKENGPYIEGSYGCVKCKMFKMKLPRDVDI